MYHPTGLRLVKLELQGKADLAPALDEEPPLSAR